LRTPIYNVKKGEKFGIIMTGQETETTLVELSGDPLMVEGEKALVFCKKHGWHDRGCRGG
jgi:hypothetical protein